MKGTIFNIQPYSIHDGPGIRTTIFFKGCPLGCLWCQNPESQQVRPQLMYHATLCVGCGACMTACPKGAITRKDEKVATDRALCVNCGACTAACPARAREISGYEIEAVDAAKKACADRMFFDESGGGVTLSGGEVLAQPAFAREILEYCKAQGVHTAVETCGFADWDILRQALEPVDLVLYDFKHMSAREHKRLTGVDNQVILENAVKIVHELGKELVGRIPLIAGLNDSLANIHRTAAFISQNLKPGTRVHLLPYNALGESKGHSLEHAEVTRFDKPTDERMASLITVLKAHGLEGVIGG